MKSPMASAPITVNPKRKETEKIEVEGDTLEIIPLGAGGEVGRSCVLLKYKGKTVMVLESYNLTASLIVVSTQRKLDITPYLTSI